MLHKYLDPKNDVAFRKIFGTEKNKDILIHFLNDMAMFKDRPQIKSISFLKTIQDPEIAAKKTSIVDILCKDAKDRQYIVEMQIAPEKGFVQRAQYNAAKAYINQADVGHKYHNLREVVFLAITRFKMFPHRKNFKSDHIILEKETHDHDLTHLAFSFLELPKFKKKIDQLENIIDKWMYFFKHGEETTEADLAKIIGNDPIIERAYSELNRFAWSEEELLTYEQAEKYEKDYLASMEYQFDEGKAEGKLEVARELIVDGMALEKVSRVTGLGMESVKKLAADVSRKEG
jgi:predicted transposase/invertase (TIGR01784 family)